MLENQGNRMCLRAQEGDEVSLFNFRQHRLRPCGFLSDSTSRTMGGSKCPLSNRPEEGEVRGIILSPLCRVMCRINTVSISGRQ